MDLSKQTVKLYEKCQGCVPGSPPDTCLHCGGEGMVGRYVPIADILAASEDLLKAAVRQALSDSKSITIPCPRCGGTGMEPYEQTAGPVCYVCHGQGRVDA